MKYLSLVIILLSLIGCITVAYRYESESGYNRFKSLDKPLVEFIIKKNRKNEMWVELKSPLLSNAIIKGSITGDQTGNICFFIESIRYFSNWSNGWTEGVNEATGEILLKQFENGYKAEVIEEFEMWDLIKGEIRFHDRYIRGEEGLKEVKNRVERINLVVDFLKENNFPDFFGHPKFKSNFGASFKKMTQPFLFPETVGLKRLQREGMVEMYDLSSDSIEDKFNIAQGFIWRKDYTKKMFPGHLHELRDTGSLWRDYEEALDLFFMFYNMDYFFKKVLPKALFKRAE